MKTKIAKFTVVFERAEEGGFIADVPLLPGCVTQGDTLEEAEKMAKDAIHAYCASLQKLGPVRFFENPLKPVSKKDWPSEYR